MLKATKKQATSQDESKLRMDMTPDEFFTHLRYHEFLLKGGLVLMISIILLVGIVIPRLSRLSLVKQELNNQKERANNLSKKIMVVTHLDKRILQERKNFLDIVLPPFNDVTAYLLTLDGLARELNLSLGDISLNPGPLFVEQKQNNNKEEIKYLETELKLLGSKESIYQFLKKVEQVIPLMIVKDVKITATGDKQSSQWVVDLKLSMVYAPFVVRTENLPQQITLFTNQDEKLLQQLREYRSFKTQVFNNNDEVNENDNEVPRNIFKSPNQLFLQEIPQSSSSAQKQEATLSGQIDQVLND